jgi:hypothetical protein
VTQKKKKESEEKEGRLLDDIGISTAFVLRKT